MGMRRGIFGTIDVLSRSESPDSAAQDNDLVQPKLIGLETVLSEASEEKHDSLEGTEAVPPRLDQRLRIKADVYVTSFMAFLYAIQFADKTMTSAATSLNLRQDLGMMQGSAYSWVGSAFYLGYLVFEFPMSYLLHRYPLARTTALIIVTWGVIITCTAACQGKSSFLACRVLLGIFESAITPSFVIITSQWYKRREQFARTCIWFGANGLGSILTSSIAYGLILRQEKHELAISGWRVLYLILGPLSIFAGVLFYFHMPNSPLEAWFLTDEEKRWQVERTRENQQSYGSSKVQWYQAREALIDPLSWLYCATVLLGNIPNGGMTTFQNLVLQGLHYNQKQSLLMSLPSGGVEFVGLILTAVISSYICNSKRMVWACGCSAVSVMCMCLLAWGPNVGSQLSGIYISNWAGPVGFVGLLSLIESNVAGHTKKVTTNAMMLVAYCVGNLIGPQTFRSSQQPEYHSGKITMAATGACQCGFEFSVALMYVWKNMRREKASGGVSHIAEYPESRDLTDWEKPDFRYAL